MKTYKCIACGSKFNDADLLRYKCSENFVGAYKNEWCPKCINKRKAIYSILEEIEFEGKEDAGRIEMRRMIEQNACEIGLPKERNRNSARSKTMLKMR